MYIFKGPQGELLQKAAATFCERQQLALEFIKKRRERDNKFDSLLSECEKKRQCRRLQIQGKFCVKFIMIYFKKVSSCCQEG